MSVFLISLTYNSILISLSVDYVIILYIIEKKKSPSMIFAAYIIYLNYRELLLLIHSHTSAYVNSCIVRSHNSHCSKAARDVAVQKYSSCFIVIKAAYANESYMWECSVSKKREVKSFTAVWCIYTHCKRHYSKKPVNYLQRVTNWFKFNNTYFKCSTINCPLTFGM